RLAALERDGALGAVHHARTGFAAAAHVGDEILRLHTGVAGFVYHGQDVFLHILVVQRLLRIVGERYQVNILLVADVESEDGYDFVADDVPVFVDAATVLPVARTHLYRNVPYPIYEVVLLEQSYETD